MSRREIPQKSKNAKNRKSEIKKKKRKLNKQAIVTTVIFTVIFVFMIGYYIFFIVHDAPDVVSNSKNPRIEEQAKTVIRGSIYASNGKALAYTDTGEDEENLEDDVRKYPYGKTFAQVVGYMTKGCTGLEDICNYTLVTPQNNAFQQIEDDFSGKVVHGCDVYTTLNVSVQKSAYSALDENKGGIFVMDPDTGAVLCTASKPSYNPEDLDEKWKSLNKRTDAVFMNRSTQGRYMPGSVFKIVTTLAYMRQNKDYDKFSFDCSGKTSFKGFQMDCYHGNVHGYENLEKAFANSCNGAFATMGLDIDTGIFNQTAEDLYFNEALPLDDLRSESSSYVKSGSFLLDESSDKYNQYYVAESSIGQQDVLVSPAQMAMIASAVANDGMLMKPYLISSVESEDGTVVKEAAKKECKQLMTKKEAKSLRKYMAAVCEYGTASIFANSDYKTYGKTGTADLHSKGEGNVNSWFVGFAKKGKKRLAIAVVLEDLPDGSASAKNCAKEVLDAYFN